MSCEHTAPFATSVESSTTPFHPGDQAQLTYNTGVDRGPSWLPGGGALLYTQEQVARADRDQCLAELPGTGGTTVRTICAASDPLGDSLNVYEAPAVAADGQLAYVRTSMYRLAGRHTPDEGALVLATVAAPLSAAVLTTLPFFSPSGSSIDLASDLAWAGAGTLVFLGEQVSYACANFGCTALDTTYAGIEIDRIDLEPTPRLSVVPGTASATSVAAGGPDTIFFTLPGSGQVHRRILSTAADSVVVDVGSPVTDLTVAGTRIAGVVGSALRVLDLGGGIDITIAKLDSALHRPALSPDGRHLVAEVAPVDTLSGRPGPADLWIWTLP